MYVTGLAQKQSRSQTDLMYITHLHQHIWSIHNSYMCPKCAYKILQIFITGFLAFKALCSEVLHEIRC